MVVRRRASISATICQCAASANAGHRVIGLDSSAGMLAHFRVNLPAQLLDQRSKDFTIIIDARLSLVE